MQRLVIVIFCAVLAIMVARDAFAVQTRGKIVSVDMGGPSMVVKEDSGATLTLAVTPKTDVQKGMKDIDLEDFKPGWIVVVRYKIEDGKNIAKYIGYESGELQRFGPSTPKRKEK